MILEIHDNEVGNTLAGKVKNIDYDYQAEQWVQDLTQEEARKPKKFVITHFILKDEAGGQRAFWTYQNGIAKLTERSDTFAGGWGLNVEFNGNS